MFRTRLKSFRELSPRTHRMMPSTTTFRFALTAAHRMIDRIHRHAADMRPPSLPAGASRLAARNIHVIDVADLSDGREATVVDSANLAGRQFYQRVTGFAITQRCLLPGAPRKLSAASGCDLNVVNVR